MNPSSTALPQPSPPALSGPKVILEGSSGSGKTFALGTLVDWAAAQSPPFEVFVLFTENGLESLLGYWADKGKPVPLNLHWHVVTTPSMGLETLTASAKKTGQLSYAALMAAIDPDRAKNNPWENVLVTLANFPCDRTGEKFGNIGSWTSRRILINDSMSESANACVRMTIGSKPVMSQPEYQVAQNNFLNWLRFMSQNLKCTFVITAHVQKNINEVTGIPQLMTKAIGKAIADEIPVLFSEVIYTLREGTNWYWDTAAVGIDTKTRYLPIASKLKPDFAQIMDKWLARARAAEGGVK